jgi:hypothetical protein
MTRPSSGFRATVSGDRLGFITWSEQGTVVLDGCGAGVFLDGRFEILGARPIDSGRVSPSCSRVGDPRFDSAPLRRVHVSSETRLRERDRAQTRRANADLVEGATSAGCRAFDSHRGRTPAAGRRTRSRRQHETAAVADRTRRVSQ